MVWLSGRAPTQNPLVRGWGCGSVEVLISSFLSVLNTYSYLQQPSSTFQCVHNLPKNFPAGKISHTEALTMADSDGFLRLLGSYRTESLSDN